MPEGKVFQQPRDLVDARAVRPRESQHDPRDAPTARVSGAADARHRSEHVAQPAALHTPRSAQDRTSDSSTRGAASAAGYDGPTLSVLRVPRTISEFLGVFRRRWRFIVGTAALCVTIAAVVTWRMPTLYRAEAVIMPETRNRVSDITAATPLAFDAAMLRDEIEVLRSGTLAAMVAERLHLSELAAFGGSTTPAPDADESRRRMQRAVATLLSRLTISNDGRSFVVRIQIMDGNPRLAADIANAYADLYLERQIAAKNESTRQRSEWLKQQISALRSQNFDLEQTIGRYRRQHGITSTHGTTVTTQELTDINSQLVSAHSDRLQKEAVLQHAKQVLGTPGGAEAASQVLASASIQRLRDQETDLLRRQAELSTRYQPAHPVMVKVQAEIDDLHGKIADEVNRVIRAMADDASAARTREDALKENLAELARSSEGQEGDQAELRQLEGEADADQTLYENLLARLKQTSAQMDIQQADAQIIGRADPPAAPFSDKQHLLATEALLSVLFGGVLAFIMDMFDPSFRRAEEIEEQAGVPVLGLLPTVEPLRPGEKPAERRETALSEALRGIKSGLLHARPSAPIGVVVVTSAAEGEGKTFFSVALGRSLVRARLRCLVVDCHFYRPGVDKLLSPAPPKGEAQPAPASGRYPQIQVDKYSGLHYIAAPDLAQRRLFRSQDLFESAEMRDYILRARDRYDLIILDAPPVPAVSDVIALCHLADATICLVRWGHTPRQTALNALRVLALRGAIIAGVVLSRVDLRLHVAYGYHDYASYLQTAAAWARRRRPLP
jgi:succinoglycan biosynthesis transport protein ExoP